MALNALKLRNRQNARMFYDLEMISETVASGDDVAEHILREAEIADLTDGLNQLEPKERDILQMRYLLQKSDQEIATIYGIKPGSVRCYLTLARRHLALILKGKESE
jgi:RNA polymerase sigma factor (sigma-70 family)